MNFNVEEFGKYSLEVVNGAYKILMYGDKGLALSLKEILAVQNLRDMNVILMGHLKAIALERDVLEAELKAMTPSKCDDCEHDAGIHVCTGCWEKHRGG